MGRSNNNYLVSKSILPWLQRTVQSPKLGGGNLIHVPHPASGHVRWVGHGVGHIIDRSHYNYSLEITRCSVFSDNIHCHLECK